MNSIEISINNIGNNINILIDTINYKLTINNQLKSITEEQLDNLIRIIRTWDNHYPKTTNALDNEKFTIIINTNENTDIIQGEGSYPENYLSFKDWIGDFYE